MRRAWPLVLMLCVAGCDLGPDYKRPETPEPGAWDGKADQAGVWPSSDWWKGFDSPVLDQLVDEAQKANPDLRAATARVREADAQARISGAALLPSIELDAAASTQRALELGQYSTFRNYMFEPTASYEIDFWGKNRAQLQSAENLALASRYDRQTVALTLVTDVANGYFQVLGLQDRLAVAERNLVNAKEVLKGVVEQNRVGNATLLDVVQQRTTVSQAQTAIPPLEQQLRQSTDGLAVLLGRLPEGTDIETKSLLTLSLPSVAPGLPSQLLERRPDVAQAEAQLISANADIKVARAQFFPSIDLTAAGGFESSALATLFSRRSGIYDLGGSLTAPIFEGGRLTGQYEYQKARFDELAETYRKSVLSAFGDVETALAAVAKTREQLAAQQETVDLARRAFEISQEQYRVGAVTLLTMLNTQNALFPAEDTLVQVRLAHLQALVSLFQALGGGWEKDKMDVTPTVAPLVNALPFQAPD